MTFLSRAMRPKVWPLSDYTISHSVCTIYQHLGDSRVSFLENRRVRSNPLHSFQTVRKPRTSQHFSQWPGWKWATRVMSLERELLPCQVLIIAWLSTWISTRQSWISAGRDSKDLATVHIPLPSIFIGESLSKNYQSQLVGACVGHGRPSLFG